MQKPAYDDLEEEAKKTKELTSVMNYQLANFKKRVNKDCKSSQRCDWKKTSLRELVATKLSTGDIKGAVDENKETQQQLMEKHPRTHPDTQLPESPMDDGGNDGILRVITREDVRLAIRSFRN